jgi:hypothetical protein
MDFNCKTETRRKRNFSEIHDLSSPVPFLNIKKLHGETKHSYSYSLD